MTVYFQRSSPLKVHLLVADRASFIMLANIFENYTVAGYQHFITRFHEGGKK